MEVSVAIPDVIRDNITDASLRMGIKFAEQFFYRAALDAGFSNSQDVARHRHRQWLMEGYDKLPPYIKDYALRVCNGENPDVGLEAERL